MKKYLSISVIIILMVFACKKKEVITRNYQNKPGNPYDSIDYGNNNPAPVEIDSNTILGIHTYIFQPRCAQPACHDGAFEPDFRTVQSAYNTLVYQQVYKNSNDSDFTYRVLPGDTAASWLHERITTNDPVLGRMPLYDKPLTPSELKSIEDWILDGAKDIFGNNPALPNTQGTCVGYLVFDTDSSGPRLDTIRDFIALPFKVPENTDLNMWFTILDADEDGNGDPDLPIKVPGVSNGNTFGQCKIRMALKPTNFDKGPAFYKEYSLTSLNITNSWLFGPGSFVAPAPGTGFYFHNIDIPTNDYKKGDIVYFRLIIDDNDGHSEPVVFPNIGSPYYLQSMFAFEII